MTALAAACGSARPHPQPPSTPAWQREGRAQSDSGTAAAAPSPYSAASLADLLAHLRGQRLSGFALLDREYQLAPDPAAARMLPRRDPESLKELRWLDRLGGLRIVEDGGDVVRVSTDLGDNAPFVPLAFYLNVEGWVAKVALVPLLRQLVEQRFGDGLGFQLFPGYPLEPLEPSTSLARFAPLRGQIVPTGLVFSDDEVALAIPRHSGGLRNLPLPAGPEMACARAPDGSTRVDNAATLARERERARRETYALAAGSVGVVTTRFADERCAVQEAHAGPLRIGPPQLLQDVCNSMRLIQTETRDAQGAGHLVVAIDTRLSSLRASVSRSQLRPSYCTPSTPAASYREHTVIVAPPGTPLYFADGSRAGQVDPKALLEPSFTRTGWAGKRPCTTLANVALPLCFEPEAVQFRGTPPTEGP